MFTKTKIHKRFLDPEQILAFAGLQPGNIIADFGCGNGYYPIAAAKLAGSNGQVFAVDIKPTALEATVSAAKQQGLGNIYTIRHDLELPGVDIKDDSCDVVILAGMLHVPQIQKNVLKETYRVLKTGGKVIIIEWKKEKLAFGPNIHDRVSENEVNDLMAKSGFRFNSEIPADAFHYALIFVK